MDSEQDNKNVNIGSKEKPTSDLNQEVDVNITKEQTFQVAKLLGDTIDNFLKKGYYNSDISCYFHLGDGIQSKHHQHQSHSFYHEHVLIF